MKVILKQNVDSLGKAGDAVKVADGYARNYLIPKGFRSGSKQLVSQGFRK